MFIAIANKVQETFWTDALINKTNRTVDSGYYRASKISDTFIFKRSIQTINHSIKSAQYVLHRGTYIIKWWIWFQIISQKV